MRWLAAVAWPSMRQVQVGHAEHDRLRRAQRRMVKAGEERLQVRSPRPQSPDGMPGSTDTELTRNIGLRRLVFWLVCCCDVLQRENVSCYMCLMSRENGDLAEAIAALRAGLEAALAEGSGKDVQFGLGDVELTLQLVADKHAGGKIGWSVLGVDAGGKSERTHSMKLVLQPRFRQKDGSYIGDFTITDRPDTAPDVGVNRT